MVEYERGTGRFFSICVPSVILQLLGLVCLNSNGRTKREEDAPLRVLASQGKALLFV